MVWTSRGQGGGPTIEASGFRRSGRRIRSDDRIVGRMSCSTIAEASRFLCYLMAKVSNPFTQS